MFLRCTVLLASLLFWCALTLWRQGYSKINGDDEGTGAAWVSAKLAFFIGLLGLLFEWHHWKQLQLLFCFFLLWIALGAFQLGLAGQGIANGYIRAEGEEARGVAPTSLYTLLFMPSGEAISKDDRPARFWYEVVCRVAIGSTLILFPTLAAMYRSVAR